MEYNGKLYGKVGNKYFDTSKTSEDFDKLEKEVKELQNEIIKLNAELTAAWEELAGEDL
jgi:peptidoglycan hydrolase CwlO-like protein